MFDQIKLNKLNAGEFFNTREKEYPDSLQKKSGSDFFSLIMERASESEHVITEKLISVDGSKSNENLKSYEQNPYERYSASNAEHHTEETPRETDYRKTSDGINAVKKETSEKRKIETETDQQPSGFVNLLYSENNIKKIGEIIRSALSGDNKDLNSRLINFFREFQSRPVNNGFLKNVSNSGDPDKIKQTTPEHLKNFIMKFRELLSAELMKFKNIRKNVKNFQHINENDLNRIIISVLDKLKKLKARDAIKHEMKTGTEEIRTEKKQSLMHENTIRKLSVKEDPFSDRNNAGDRNSGKENTNTTGGKADFLSKTGLDRSLTAIKGMDFRENLQEIIDKAKISVRDSRNGSFTVRLNPRELGNVNVNLIMENGVITGKFLVDNDHVKNQLMDNLMYLKHQLEESGISVGEFSVNVNNQRGKFLNQDNENTHVYMPRSDSGREITAASEQYSQAAGMHDGYINMVI